MINVPVMSVEDVEERARHEGAAKELRYIAKTVESNLSYGYAHDCKSILQLIHDRTEYHEGFLK